MLVVEVSPEALTSPVIKGRMRRARLQKPPKHQARPLSVAEVLWLEAFLVDPAS